MDLRNDGSIFILLILIDITSLKIMKFINIEFIYASKSTILQIINEVITFSTGIRDRFSLPRIVVKRDVGRRYTYTGKL